MGNRDRSAGWKHAKLTGHKNEALVKDLLDSNTPYANKFLSSIGVCDSIKETSIGGLHETNVPSINGNTTKAKTDLKIYLNNGKNVNISIKKSLGGQVYFVSAELFIETFERQFDKKIPASVKRTIQLFWSAADDAIEIIKEFADKSNKKDYDMQLRHKSLNATTLKNYNIKLYEDMLGWFTENIFNITELCFARGAAKDKDEWAEYIWYINLLKENNIDDIFRIYDICSASKENANNEIYYGAKNGGTTIQLPFGFVQWHQGKLQFHHSYDKISNIITSQK